MPILGWSFYIANPGEEEKEDTEEEEEEEPNDDESEIPATQVDQEEEPEAIPEEGEEGPGDEAAEEKPWDDAAEEGEEEPWDAAEEGEEEPKDETDPLLEALAAEAESCGHLTRNPERDMRKEQLLKRTQDRQDKETEKKRKLDEKEAKAAAKKQLAEEKAKLKEAKAEEKKMKAASGKSKAKGAAAAEEPKEKQRVKKRPATKAEDAVAEEPEEQPPAKKRAKGKAKAAVSAVKDAEVVAPVAEAREEGQEVPAPEIPSKKPRRKSDPKPKGRPRASAAEAAAEGRPGASEGGVTDKAKKYTYSKKICNTMLEYLKVFAERPYCMKTDVLHKVKGMNVYANRQAAGYKMITKEKPKGLQVCYFSVKTTKFCSLAANVMLTRAFLDKLNFDGLDADWAKSAEGADYQRMLFNSLMEAEKLLP